MTERARIFGVWLDTLDMEQTLERCRGLIAEERPVQHVVLNASKVVMMEDVPGLREIVNACDLVSADGMSVVWAGRFLGVPVPERVAGIDLMERLLGECEKQGWSTYFLGAKSEVLETFVGIVRERYPRLEIAGCRDGYFDDDAAVAESIQRAAPQVLFVAITSPRKEQFLAEQLRAMGPVFAMGVGGSFDVWAGVTKRAPSWMQRVGLEWFYRFIQEPGRMWKRYLIGNTRFAVLTLKERLGRHR